MRYNPLPAPFLAGAHSHPQHTRACTHTLSLLLTLGEPSSLVSSKAIDSQSKEQSGNYVSDDDASQAG